MRSPILVLSACALLAVVPSARAQSTTPVAAGEGTSSSPVAALPPEGRSPSWGFSGTFGYGSAGGDFGNTLEHPLDAQFDIFRQHGQWRFGAGLSLGSLSMKSPYEKELEFGLLRWSLFGTRMFRKEGKLHPYLQVRVGTARLHPRSELFTMDPLPEDFATGDSPTKAANGWSASVVPGIEWNFNRKVALDISASWTRFGVSEYDLSAVGMPPASSGNLFQGRIGVRFHPDNGLPAGPRESVAADGERDAWGVGQNHGWAMAEVLAINLVASGTNEYTRNANFNQVSPRSWWQNLDHGFTYDDNEFRTNQYIHPFNGAAYYNSARSNGLNYWTSSAYAVFGAFFWEAAGETHPMSINDMVSTGIGGMALGEMQYRLTSEILNNEAGGIGRVAKEFAGFLVDPVRGFNRIVSGRGGYHPNPTDPLDWRPPHKTSLFMLGARTIGEGESIGENTKTYANIGFDHTYGSPFDNTRRKPFDYMDVSLQMSGQEKVPLNLVRIKGDLWEKPLGSDASAPNHVFAVFQQFDYMNNNAFEFGGQSVGAALMSRFRLSEKTGISTRLDGTALILGGINSEYAKVAEVANRERLREYDYGPGLGGTAQAALTRSGRPLVTLGYRFQWISVSNGSVVSKGQSGQGSDASHYIQMAGGRVVVPVFRSLGLGADAYIFLRKSRYTLPLFHDIDQRNPQVRVFVAWSDAQ